MKNSTWDLYHLSFVLDAAGSNTHLTWDTLQTLLEDIGRHGQDLTDISLIWGSAQAWLIP